MGFLSYTFYHSQNIVLKQNVFIYYLIFYLIFYLLIFYLNYCRRPFKKPWKIKTSDFEWNLKIDKRNFKKSNNKKKKKNTQRTQRTKGKEQNIYFSLSILSERFPLSLVIV